jgi:hypothetical protein
MNLNTTSLPSWSTPIRELSNIFGLRIIFTRCVQETLGCDLLSHILTNKKTMVSWQMTIVMTFGIVTSVGWFQGFKLYQGLGQDLDASLRTDPACRHGLGTGQELNPMVPHGPVPHLRTGL